MGVEDGRAKAPWRCLVESCAFVVCEPCSTYVQLELARLKERRSQADEDGAAFDFDDELRKLEAGGPVGLCPDTETGGSSPSQGKENETPEKAGRLAGFADKGDDDDYDDESTIEVDPKLEDDIDYGDGAGGYSEFVKRPFTRSAAAAAAASARARARRPTVVKRDRDRDRDATEN